MGGKGSGRRKTPPRSNVDPNTLTEEELTVLCFGKPLSERIWKEEKLKRKRGMDSARARFVASNRTLK